MIRQTKDNNTKTNGVFRMCADKLARFKGNRNNLIRKTMIYETKSGKARNLKELHKGPVQSSNRDA